MSLQYNLRSTITPIELPPLYLDEIIAEDEINDTHEGDVRLDYCVTTERVYKF